MVGEPFEDQLLGSHDRSGFRSGVEPLDHYLVHQAGQDQRRKLAATYLLVEVSSGSIAGFYTLSAFTIRPPSLPAEVRRRLPRYEAYPALLIGRLAIDVRWRGQGLGRRLLGVALLRCLALAEQLGAMAVVVDAKDEAARSFYEHLGFRRLQDDEFRLYLPVRSITRVLESE